MLSAMEFQEPGAQLCLVLAEDVTVHRAFTACLAANTAQPLPAAALAAQVIGREARRGAPRQLATQKFLLVSPNSQVGAMPG